jgi:hypothetical protein
MRAALTMKRRLEPESVFGAVGDSPWLVDRRRTPLLGASYAVGRTETVLTSLIVATLQSLLENDATRTEAVR